MNVFFKIMLFVFIFIIMSNGAVYAEPPVDAVSAEAADPVEKTPSVDPNTPAPPSPIQLRLPHSQRTKANVLDAVVDFLLTKYFKLFKNAEISYDFFEIDKEFDLNFTNFTVKITSPDIQGKVVIPKAKVNFDEFLTFIKGKKMIIPKVEFSDPFAELTLIEKEKEKKRLLKYSAKKMLLKKIHVTFVKNKQRQTQDITIGSVSTVKASLVISNPSEKYSVPSAEMKDVVLPNKRIFKFSFSSVDVDGKTYTDRAAFLQAIRQ